MSAKSIFCNIYLEFKTTIRAYSSNFASLYLIIRLVAHFNLAGKSLSKIVCVVSPACKHMGVGTQTQRSFGRLNVGGYTAHGGPAQNLWPG